ncbi:endonuclease/exonuclease/phosphatase family protein [Azohydromonas aeria]|uniref:endonuclease/exonuclease/phosphatase family protein n=1 Tax=Azohydromonas aeria TaxID=2590212 RepID=UPI0012F7FC68|nr:endonuclease/exonuclease/phosphatase family protein [Azohydromonas aeria]
MKSLRIGIWNLGRSGAFHRTRIPRQLEVLRQLDADLWVLTEAHDANLPPDGHACKSTPGAEFHQLGEHRVIVWSRHALDAVATQDAASTVAVRLQPPGLERPLLLYGTVMTHAQGGALQRQALAWQRHQAAVQRQCAEWLRLRQEFRDHLLCVAGDFNASLEASARYGSVDPRRSILQGLADAGMKCLTTDERRGSLAPQGPLSGMDHMAVTEEDGLASRLAAVPSLVNGHRLSDREGILVELAWP